MRVLVTRTQPQADEWVARLQAAGIADAVALPLIDIAPAAEPSLVDAAWEEVGGMDLVVFVSPNAAERFFERRPAGLGWPARVLAGAPGPGTAQVLERLGVLAPQRVAPAPDAPQFDSQALWAVLENRRDWAGAQVMVVRGDGGRDWLAQTLRAHGAAVRHVAAYRRRPPEWDAERQALLDAALAAPAHHLWFFSSSEAIDHLAQATATAAPRWQHAQALATHPRIAQRARELGFGTVRETAPTLAAVSRCIQSLEP
jgi:uroporphyrinogen-III synthase